MLNTKNLIFVFLLVISVVCVGQTQSESDIKLAELKNALSERRYDDVLSQLKNPALANNSEAIFINGLIYNNGSGVLKDAVQANKYFTKSALMGNNNAQFILARNYDKGIGFATSDVNEAFKWFKLSAEGKHLIAMYEVAERYYNGVGTKVDVNQARKWYQQVASVQIVTSQSVKELVDKANYKLSLIPAEVDKATSLENRKSTSSNVSDKSSGSSQDTEIQRLKNELERLKLENEIDALRKSKEDARRGEENRQKISREFESCTSEVLDTWKQCQLSCTLSGMGAGGLGGANNLPCSQKCDDRKILQTDRCRSLR